MPMYKVVDMLYGPNAEEGDFIKDMTPRQRSLGYVLEINMHTNMMRVKFPKVGRIGWVIWENHGQYRVV